MSNIIKLKNTKNNYEKSNDEKNYLTEIKGITGNILSDSELNRMYKTSESEFIEKFKRYYSNLKQEERINFRERSIITLRKENISYK